MKLTNKHSIISFKIHNDELNQCAQKHTCHLNLAEHVNI